VRRIEGRVAVLDRPDVDTDQIMPKQFLKLITRTGYGQYVFFDWAKDPDFELNRPEYRGARILIAGRNFGCGSSRENAAWGLQEYGFQAIIAPSFGDIFRQNCLKIGVLPIRLDYEIVRDLHTEPELAVDVEACTVEMRSGRSIPFELDAFSQYRLLSGLDEIGLTLKHEDEIEAFEQAHPVVGLGG
jgi:3-isopropylmalate/(R)-2-methylmalate dehydratase small subunit